MSQKKIQITEEFRLIPWWAYAVAGLLIAALNLALGFGLMHTPIPPPIPVQLVLGVVASAVLAFFVLLIGYVNRDAKRRNMNSALWTLLVIFIPNAIGFILYFLLRQPVLVECPQCHAMANPGFNFCPKCKFNLRPTCPACQRAIQAGDTFCPYCAHELKPATS